MLASFFTFSLTLLLLIILYLLYFLVLKPLIGIRFYKSQGIKMSFFPLLGTVKDCLNALATTDDFYGHWKRQAKQDPNLQAVGGNFLDRPHIFLIEPQLIKDFFRNQENYIKVPSINDLMKVTSHDGLVSAEGEIWKRHRKIVSSAFRFEILKEMVPEIVKISDQFIENFKDLDLNRVDLSEEFQTIAGEVVGRLFFGVEFHDYRIQGKPAIAFLNDLSYRIGEQGFTVAYLIFGIKAIEWGFLPKYVKIRRDTKEFRGVIASIIEDKKAQAKKKDPTKSSDSPVTFLDVLLSQDIVNSEQSFSTEEMMNEFVTLVGAGSVTTGETISRGLYYLDKNPQYKENLMEEVNKYFKDPSKVTLEDLNQMEFMTAFTKEVLRFFPNQIGVFDRETIKDHTLGDLKVKKGTIVNVAGLCNNFNPLYHDNEDDFNPERWLKNSKTKESCTKDPLLFIPFSAGPRSCIGQQLAMVEIKVMLSLFLKKYDCELDPNYKLRTTMRIGYGPLEVMHFKLIPK